MDNEEDEEDENLPATSMISLRRAILPVSVIALLAAGAVFFIDSAEPRHPHSRNASAEFGKTVPITADFAAASLAGSVELINQNLAQLKLKDSLRVTILKNGDPLPEGLVRIKSDTSPPANPFPAQMLDEATSPELPAAEVFIDANPLVSTEARESFAQQPFRNSLRGFLQYFPGNYSCFYAGHTAYIYSCKSVRTVVQTRKLYIIETEMADDTYGTDASSPLVADITKRASDLAGDLPAGTRVEYDRIHKILVIHADDDAADTIEYYIAGGKYASPYSVHTSFARRKVRLSEWWYSQKMWMQTANAWIRNKLGLPAPP